jgi:hypothetical protein
MKLYISDLSLFLLAVFYLPLVILVLWRIARSRLTLGMKALALVSTLVVAYAIPLGDVTMNSIAMARVCPTAGLHIYKRVKVEGYFDRSGGEDVLQKYPYRFIETKRPGTKIIRFERQADGSINRTELDAPTAEYEVVYDSKAPVPELGVRSRQRWWVRDRTSGDAVGEWLAFSPMHGWVDRYLLNRWFGVGLPGCSGEKGLASRFPFELLPPNSSS